MIKKLYFLFFFLISLPLGAQSVQLSDSATVSLLTNSPWNGAVYTLYGHTAIRVSDKANNLDWVFNYGVFNFNAPNFIYRFAKGETDYMLAAYPFSYYMEERRQQDVAAYEQRLSLTQAEKQRIWDALCINSLPENREYRYNFFFDNCATRPRDIIERGIDGKITYMPVGKSQTFRDLIHECVTDYPWVRFGIDLVIGNKADREITDREKMFLPLYLKRAYDGAVVVSAAGAERKLVAEESLLIKGSFQNFEKTHFSPLVVGIFALIVGIAVAVLLFRGCVLPGKVYSILLFSAAGITGCIISFLAFSSEHPATFPNWNLIWLNPLQLIIACLIPVKYCSKAVYCYHFINFALLSLFLLLWAFIPQHLETAFIPYVLSLWWCSGTHFVQGRLNKQKH
ncbi:MAG: DUF4105 domain-containing protein [Prevotella sp.]|jgi:hypothetical protein|nr:DUF4105 domain-containing protein [Prevotella sp.]